MSARLLAVLRVSRRMVRRAPARSALVAALIALPVLVGTFALVTIRTAHLPPGEAARRTLGGADAVAQVTAYRRLDPTVSVLGRSSNGQTVESLGPSGRGRSGLERSTAWAAQLPASSRIIPDRWQTGARVATPGRSVDTQLVGLDLADPLAAGTYDVRAGRVPRGPAEIAVTSSLAHRLAVHPGSTVSIRTQTGLLTRTVSGVVRDPFSLDEQSVVGAVPALGGFPAFRDASERGTWLIDTPGPAPDLHDRLAGQGVIYETRQQWEQPGDVLVSGKSINAQYLIVLATVAGFGLLEILLLAGAAFAVGARRQTRELGLLAATGGDSRDIRNAVLGQGLVLGLVGAIAGAGLAVAAVELTRSHLEGVAGHVFGPLTVHPLDLVVMAAIGLVAGLLAAVVPARYAARRSVLDSLRDRFRSDDAAARNPRWATAALIVGPALVLLSSYMWRHTTIGGFNSVQVQVGDARQLVSGLTRLLTQNAWPSGIWIGTAVTLAGLVRSCGAALGRMARLAARLPLGPRLALRDAARHRHRSAPAAAAVMTVLAGIVIVLFVVSSAHLRREQDYQPAAPIGSVAITTSSGNAAGPALGRAAQQVQAALGGTTTLVGSTVDTTSRARPRYVLAESAGCRGTLNTCAEGPLGVVDPASLHVLAPDLPPTALRLLADGGAILLDSNFGTATHHIHAVDKRSGTRATLPAALSVIPSYYQLPPLLVSTATARAHGWPVTPTVALVTPTHAPAQVAVDRLQQQLGNRVTLVLGRPFHDDGYPVVLLALLGAALLATLAGTSISVALALAESRADLATLAAVGASPGRRRLHAMGQAATVSLLGAVLGVLLGAFVATETLHGSVIYAVSVPYRWLAVIVVGAPLVAVLVAGAMTRSRVTLTRRIA